MNSPTDGIGEIYTKDEAAARLRLSNRELLKIARRIGACSQAGRNYLFSEADITAIWEECRVEPTAPRRVQTVGSAGSYGARSLGGREGGIFELLRSPLPLDGREIEVLNSIRSSSRPVSHNDIPRAGEKTIIKLLADGYLVRSDDGTSTPALVKISQKGKEGLDKYARWEEKRKAHLNLRWR